MDFLFARELDKLNHIKRTYLKRAAKFISFWAIIGLLLYLIGHFIYLFLPFILALIITVMISPLKYFFIGKLRLPAGLAVLIAMTLELGVIGLLIIFLVNSAVNEIKDIYLHWPLYQGMFKEVFDNWLSSIQTAYLNIPADYIDIIRNTIINIFNSVPHLLTQGVTLAIAIPQLIIILVITLVAAYFMSKNSKYYIQEFIHIFPVEWQQNLSDLGGDFSRALAGFIKAEFIIFLIKMFCCILGLYILRTKYFMIMGIITGLFGILPVLGVGIVLVPWAVFAYISGQSFLALGLLLLTAAITVIHHMIEPKILGENIGLDPLFVLISMYIGLEAAGLIGLVLGPFILIAHQALRKAGFFQNL
jgi:sporulation integral membrane protein YtvI